MSLQMCANGLPQSSLKHQVSWKEITSPDLVFAALLQINSLQIPNSFDLLLPLSPTHGISNNVKRYSVKPGPHVRARPPTQSVASKWPISPRYSLRNCDSATSVSWHVAACPVHSDDVVLLPSYHDRSCPPVNGLMKIMSTGAVPRPTATGQRRIVVFQIKCGTIPQQRRPSYHATHSEEFRCVRDRPF